ncbi:DUF2309 domain-containing protein [soil metagenome]
MTQAISAATLTDKILEASQPLNCFWPLTNFIACNSLKGFENQLFEEAMQKGRKFFNARGYLPLAEYRAMYETGRIAAGDLQEARDRMKAVSQASSQPVDSEEPEPILAPLSTLADFLDEVHGSNILLQINQQSIKWCSAYFDTSQAQWAMAKDGLYKSWRQLAPFDYTLSIHGSKHWRRVLSALPDEPKQALQALLNLLGVAEHETVQYLERHLVQLPGWASHLKWRQTQGLSDILSDYLAIRLFYELCYSEPLTARIYQVTERPWAALYDLRAVEFAKRTADSGHADDWSAVWQEAYEINYRNQLVSDLRRSNAPSPASANGSASSDCQLVFCIDVRSEPVRRALESVGNYSTYGFAGFFGFAMRLQPLNSKLSLDLCPVLFTPEKTVNEIVRPGVVESKAGNLVSDKSRAQRLAGMQALLAASLQLRKRLKSSLIGAFGLVETFGLWSALPLVGRTFWPQKFQRSLSRATDQLFPAAYTHLDTGAFSLEEKIALAEGCLRGIGITENFAKVVVMCGHKSTSANNPYASALDCGACGGNSGGHSAKLAVQILNQPDVRSGLLAKGLNIPGTTVFVAAEHDTTDDRFELFNVEQSLLFDGDQNQIIDQLKNDLEKTGAAVRAERLTRLPKSVIEAFNAPSVRGEDWAQVAPEWGLAGNAAFIAAPRSLTKGLDLKGRTFLHSYEHGKDSNNAVLEIIMTAPLVVAQWINMQYYLSTVDNDVFGSGSKVLHNVVGDFGVMRGGFSDLQLGLPWQSVMAADGSCEHEPMRLLAVIQAPREALDRVLSKHKAVADLVENRWIRLVAVEPEATKSGALASTDLKFYQADGLKNWRELKTLEIMAFGLPQMSA